MRAPGFWSAAPSHPAGLLLSPLAHVYGALTAARMDRPGAPPPGPVICIGNFTLGGAGKTPTAIRVARMLREEGLTPAVLSRGYGGRLPGPLIVDRQRHAATDVGDEPLLLSQHAAAIVARDRPAGARLCVESGADAIVMDDGLQNPSLTKTLALAVVDGGYGTGNGRVFPAGPLRAPLARQWRHVGGLVLIGEGAPGERIAHEAQARGIPVHRAHLDPENDAGLAGRRVVAFAGIGRPEKFFETLEGCGAEIARRRSFPDHHPYGDGDLAGLLASAEQLGAVLVTTEKDAVRLPAEFAEKVTVLRVGLRFEDEGPLRRALRDAVTDFSGRARVP